ncbi:MAG: thioredoxin [Alphaproteobacteria bacterium]|nr:thioredoxin [Alphaproteobacteria bacterium]MBO7537390.1 thioredoxin [Alphaproteobacteria bacterium]MCR4623696.1 thioredoxin [Alphaproteobacteria bacterium]
MLHTDETNFQENVLDKDFAVVDFSAEWCGPCRMIGPFLESIEEQLGIEIMQVNIDESPNISAKYEVMSIPTVMIFKKGEKVAENVGAASKARLTEWIKSHQ